MLLIISRCAGVFLRNTLKPSMLSLTECHSFQILQDAILAGRDRRLADALGQSRCGQTDLEPQADLQGKDRRFDAVERLIEIAPEGDSAKEGGNCALGGFGTAAVPDSLEIHLIGHVPTVARLDVVERPCDDDPPQFSKLGVQLSLELVADLGSQLGPAEAD